MVFTEKDRQAQFAYIMGWHRRLVGSAAINRETFVWHYTTGDGLIAILKSGSIYATQASCLNDTTELRYAANLVKKALRKKLESLERESRVHAYLRDLADSMDDTPQEPNTASSFNFVTCFSTQPNDLTMWRGYGGGENGYSIAVRVADLLGAEGALVGLVNYDATVHAELSAEIATATVRLFEDGLAKQRPEEVDDWQAAFSASWNFMLSAISPFAKDHGFESEHEFRMVRAFQGPDMKKLVFRQRGNMMVRHLPLEIGKRREDGSLHFPVKAVFVGPSRHQSISGVSVSALLASCEYPVDIPVHLSRLPFQAT